MKILTVAFLAATAVQGAEFTVRDFGAAEDAAPAANGGDRLEFGIRDIRFENCSFGGRKPVVQSDRGVKFPVSSNDVTFVATQW